MNTKSKRNPSRFPSSINIDLHTTNTASLSIYASSLLMIVMLHS